MSVVDEQSTQWARTVSVPPANNPVNEWRGKLRIMLFDYTRAAAGDATSKVYLAKLPAGKITVIGDLSYIRSADQGSTGTIDVGYDAYVGSDGVAVIADPDAFVSALDNSGQAAAALFTEALSASTDKRDKTFDSVDGVDIILTVNSAAQQAGTVINGRIVFVED